MVLHIDPTSRSLYGIISITSQSPACLTRILTANEVSPHHKQCGLWVGGWLVGCSAALQWHRSGYTYSFWNWVSNIGIGVKVYVYTWVRVNWQQFASDKTQPTRIFLPMRCIKCFSSIYPKHSYRHLVYVQKPLRLSLYVWYGVSHSMRRRCIYAHKKAITSAEQNSRSNYMIRMLKFDMTRPKFNPMGVCRVFDGGYVFDGTASLSLFALGVSVDFFTPSPLDPPANMTRRGCLLPRRLSIYPACSPWSMAFMRHYCRLPGISRSIQNDIYRRLPTPTLCRPSWMANPALHFARRWRRRCILGGSAIFTHSTHTHIYIYRAFGTTAKRSGLGNKTFNPQPTTLWCFAAPIVDNCFSF